MIMSLIIILPLLSASTWFQQDPNIDQMIQNYAKAVNNLSTISLQKTFVKTMITSSLATSSPIIYLSVTTKLAIFIYPDNFP